MLRITTLPAAVRFAISPRTMDPERCRDALSPAATNGLVTAVDVHAVDR
jgi:hypothetical protein